MNWDDIVAAFARPTRGYPVAAARAVLDDPEHYEHLVSEFERISTQPDEMIVSMFHLHAMYLLAEKRETRAFRPLMRIAALPQDVLDEVLGQHLTESFKCCVAAACEDERLIREFVENRQHAEWARYILVGALVNRVMAGDSPAEPLLEWLVALGDKTLLLLQEQPDAIDTVGDELLMNSLVGAISKIGSLEHLAIVQRWWDANVLDPQIAGIDWYTKELNRPLEERRQWFFAHRQAYVPDAIGEMSRWYCFSDGFHDPQSKAKVVYQPPAEQLPFIRETVKVGRNDPCLCGSGKKYKKCCGS